MEKLFVDELKKSLVGLSPISYNVCLFDALTIALLRSALAFPVANKVVL